MIEELIHDIARYFEVLQNRGYYLAFHNFFIPLQNYMTLLTPYNISSNPFCLMVKSDKSAWDHCIERQKKVLEACADGPMKGICYAGMGEYVFPVRIFPVRDEKHSVLAFISVSGYRISDDVSIERIKYVAKKYRYNEEQLLQSYYRNLSPELPSIEALRTEIAPLCRMFELLYHQLPPDSAQSVANVTQSNILSHAVVYLRRHYAQPVSVKDIAEYCHCSVSTLSHLFKKNMKMSITDYRQQLRIQNAVRLLQDTDLPVGIIGAMSGYEEQNYFSNVFRKEIGCSPTDFRQRKPPGL